MALLRRGDLSVTEVCFAVGCSSLGTFSTRFTELVGVPPQRLSAPRDARDGGDPVMRRETGDQTDQESRSAGHRAAVRVTAMDITTTTLGVNMTGSSTQGIKTVLHPVSDLATAKAVYAALLGVPPQTDGSYYIGFEAPDQHIGRLG
jgi:hypothetical protein